MTAGRLETPVVESDPVNGAHMDGSRKGRLGAVRCGSYLIRLGAIFLLASTLSSCAVRHDGMRVSKPDSSSATASGATFPDPGPFKLVKIEEADGSTSEYWQARGELGRPGGTLRLSSFGTGPKTFNVWAASDVESSGIGYLMFEHLVDVDAWTGKPYPRLAKTIEISPDRLEYKIRLRKGLKWSDGHPLTADDVVFTFGTIVAKGYGNSSFRDTLSVYGKFPSVEKIDDLTVKFRTSVPFAPFLNSLAGVCIAPKHVLEPITRKPVSEFNQFWDINADPKSMVVSGRFMLQRYTPGQRLEFVRNPNYRMVDRSGAKLPYLDRFVEAIVPDQNTQLLKFYGDEIDFLDVRSVRGSDAALMKQRETQDKFHMFNLGPDDGTMFFIVNMNRRKNPKTGKFYVDPVKQKWFNSLYFRQALSHAVDRQRMVDSVLRGVGLPLYTSESPAAIFVDKDLKPYPQDLKLAAQLLAKGGFVKRDDELYDDEGHRVEFTLHTNAGNTARDAACVMIVNDLQNLGIKVNYQPIDFNILVGKVDQSLDWEGVVMGLTGSKIEPYDGANVWKSDGRLHLFDQRLPNDNGKVVVSDARDWEKSIDKLFDRGATTFDEAKRHDYFNQYQAIVYEQQPYIYLYAALNLTAMKDRIGNYRPMPLGVSYTPLGSLHNLEEIYVKR